MNSVLQQLARWVMAHDKDILQHFADRAFVWPKRRLG
jgi:hypothetical protein